MGWQVEYMSGTDVLVVAGQCLILLPGETPVAIRSRAWELAAAGVGILDMLEALSVHGAGPVNEAAVVVEDADGCVALLRGGMSVVTDQGTFGARSRFTWTEDELDAQTFTVRSREASEGLLNAPDWLPIRAAMVRCGAVRVVRGDGPAGDPRPAHLAVGRDAQPEGPADSVVVAEAEEMVAPEPGTAAAALQVGADANLQAPLVPEEDSTAILPVAAGADAVDPRMPVRDTDEPGVPTPDMVAAESGAGDAESEDDYDRLFGATSWVARRVPAPPSHEPPGVPSGSNDREEPHTPASGVLAADVAAADVPVAEVPLVGPPAEPVEPLGHHAGGSSAELIDFVPGLEPAGAPDPVAAVAPIDPASDLVGDHDGRTVLRSSRSRGPDATVRAILCPSGHANPPEAVACRVCRMDVGDAPIQTISRPAVGVLRIESRVEGAPDTIPLERSLIVGRKPSSQPSGAGHHDASVVIDVPGGELSRNHVRLTLEGWHVLVTDLGSTNGTVVTLPGRTPTRLRRGEATPITPGTVITLAETVSYRYQVQ